MPTFRKLDNRTVVDYGAYWFVVNDDTIICKFGKNGVVHERPATEREIKYVRRDLAKTLDALGDGDINQKTFDEAGSSDEAYKHFSKGE